MSACSASLTPRLIATEFFFSQCGQVSSIRTCCDVGLVAICGPLSESYAPTISVYRLNVTVGHLSVIQGITPTAIIRVLADSTAQWPMGYGGKLRPLKTRNLLIRRPDSLSSRTFFYDTFKHKRFIQESGCIAAQNLLLFCGLA